MKGQAFSTFQLMIAAIVAIAILGVLMSILNVIPQPGANPIQVMEDLLRDGRQYQGSSFVSSSDPSFQSGMMISEESFKQSVFQGVDPTITFVCSDNLGDSCDNSTAGQLTVVSDFSAKVTATCSDSTTCTITVG